MQHFPKLHVQFFQKENGGELYKISKQYPYTRFRLQTHEYEYTERLRPYNTKVPKKKEKIHQIHPHNHTIIRNVRQLPPFEFRAVFQRSIARFRFRRMCGHCSSARLGRCNRCVRRFSFAAAIVSCYGGRHLFVCVFEFTVEGFRRWIRWGWWCSIVLIFDLWFYR